MRRAIPAVWSPLTCCGPCFNEAAAPRTIFSRRASCAPREAADSLGRRMLVWLHSRALSRAALLLSATRSCTSYDFAAS